jgi:hypothetical protein
MVACHNLLGEARNTIPERFEQAVPLALRVPRDTRYGYVGVTYLRC